MPHNIYSTESFIVSTRNVGESSQYILLFTEMLGAVWVMARGIRKGCAKLRPQTDLYAHVRVTLVKGRHSWRLIEVSHISDCSFLRMNFMARRSIARMFLMLRRFSGIEVQQQELFREVCEIYSHVRFKPYTAKHARLLDIYVAYIILAQLGYLYRTPATPLLSVGSEKANTFSYIQHALGYISVREKALTARINMAIDASGL
jgi:recombinational DNA repair protein (RecF pathway)